MWNVGSVTVTRVIEHRTELAVGDFLPTADGEALARHRDWLSPWAVGDAGQLRFVIQALCLESNGQKIVVDTCIGPQKLPGIYAGLSRGGAFPEGPPSARPACGDQTARNRDIRPHHDHRQGRGTGQSRPEAAIAQQVSLYAVRSDRQCERVGGRLPAASGLREAPLPRAFGRREAQFDVP